MTRYPQVKRLDTLEAFRARLDELGLTASVPVAEAVGPDGVLGTPVGLGAGLMAANRLAVLPMEGWDGDADGRPTDLVRRRWGRFGASGCGLVWGEATAVRPDGRANPHQLVLDERTVDDVADLRARCEPGQVVGLQLTHSGRWARPLGEPAPRTAYRHPVLDGRVGAGAAAVLGDDELDELAARYVEAAVLVGQAGFDFVDLKACHGYLVHELLTAHDRPGRYGGDLEGRSRFLRSVVAGVRERVPGLAVAVRLSVFDLRPFAAGEGGVGVPEGDGPWRLAFGGDGSGLGVDLGEAVELVRGLRDLGVRLVCTTAGSPYYTPHVQRPAWFPPSDGYTPPEDPLVGVARQLAATAELAAAVPEVALVGSGYSYLQGWLPVVAEAVVAGGGASMVGLGRMALSYPDLAHDVLAGRPLRDELVCRTFSDCTTAPRNGLVSGCFPLDPFYKAHPQRVELAAVKKAVRSRRA